MENREEKMPVCHHFLRGVCTNETCPYSHVYVDPDAEVCPDFLKGYCPKGAKCKLRHTNVCQTFLQHGICPKGKYCKLKHFSSNKRPAKKRKEVVAPKQVPSTLSIQPNFGAVAL